MKNYILILLLFAVSWTAFGQAPVQRNPWSTNVTGNAVRGNNNLSVTNLTSGTNWLFYGVQASTVARLTDITNAGTGLFVLKAGDTMTGPLRTVGFTNTGGMTNTGIIVGNAGIEAGTYVQAGSAYSFMWPAKSQISSGANNYVDFYNAAATDFYGLRFGGTATTNAMLYYTSAGRDTVDGTPNLEVKLGDGSDWTDLKARRIQLDDATATVGNARGVNAVDLQAGRNAATKVASGFASFIGGGTNNTASGAYSAAFGTGCSSIGIATLSGGNSTTVSGDQSCSWGYANNIVGSATSSAIFGSNSSITSATADNSFVTGSYANSHLFGAFASSAGRFGTTGDSQMMILKARALMTIATSTITNVLIDASDNLTLPANTSWGCTIQVVGRSTDAGTGDEESAYYEIKCLFERDNAAANTRLVGTSTKVVVAEDDAAWDADVSADTTNGALTITVTGNNETTVRWNATVYLTQLGG